MAFFIFDKGTAPALNPVFYVRQVSIQEAVGFR